MPTYSSGRNGENSSAAVGNEAGAEGRSPQDRGGLPPAQRLGFFHRPLVILGAGVLFLVLLVAGIVWWLDARKYVNTDDAFVDTHIIHVAPRIAGQIIQVLANDNEAVHRGQLLVVIDPADAQARLSQLLAQEAQAQTQLEQAQAQVMLSQASFEQQTANAKGVAAQATNAAQDLARYNLLKRTLPLAIAEEQYDTAVATARNSAAQRDAAQKQARGAEDQIAASRAQLSGAIAAIKSLQAEVRQAELNLSYTHISAPEDGHIAQRSVAVGDYIEAGQQLLAVVPLKLWITANFEETQIAHMRPGQHVEIDADSCPQVSLHGHIDSIQRGAGQAFGLLPPENATGNFVKVVQRVPVKILIDNVPRDCTLGPGMSVEPTVKIR
jgi:membrane fusion protein (multidrug efflux system)